MQALSAVMFIIVPVFLLLLAVRIARCNCRDLPKSRGWYIPVQINAQNSTSILVLRSVLDCLNTWSKGVSLYAWADGGRWVETSSGERQSLHRSFFNLFGHLTVRGCYYIAFSMSKVVMVAVLAATVTDSTIAIGLLLAMACLDLGVLVFIKPFANYIVQIVVTLLSAVAVCTACLLAAGEDTGDEKYINIAVWMEGITAGIVGGLILIDCAMLVGFRLRDKTFRKPLEIQTPSWRGVQGRRMSTDILQSEETDSTDTPQGGALLSLRRSGQSFKEFQACLWHSMRSTLHHWGKSFSRGVCPQETAPLGNCRSTSSVIWKVQDKFSNIRTSFRKMISGPIHIYSPNSNEYVSNNTEAEGGVGSGDEKQHTRAAMG